MAVMATATAAVAVIATAMAAMATTTAAVAAMATTIGVMRTATAAVAAMGTAMAATMAATMTAVAGTKTTAATAMAGDTDNNQLKGAAEETTAVATVMAVETATAKKTVMVTAKIRTATPMFKVFLVGSNHNNISAQQSTHFFTEMKRREAKWRRLFSARVVQFFGVSMLFLAGVVQFFSLGDFANKRESHTYDSVYYLRRKKQPKTP
jgi:hypothetical protein